LAPQTYGAHERVDAAGQKPLPSQLAAAVSVPPEQLAARQGAIG
jgi:hypothetical protein